MKITMYELLGLVKDGKAPKKIRYDGKFYEFNNKKDNYYENETCSINWDYVSLHCLNEEVEILEEEKKIPEKLDVLVEVMSSDKIGALTNEIGEIQRRFNQLLDYLKSKGE